MQLVIGRDGTIRGIYGEAIDLAALGPLDIERASHVEPDPQGRWLADLSPVGGPVLGPFERRSDALMAEVYWLEENWLDTPGMRPSWTMELDELPAALDAQQEPPLRSLTSVRQDSADHS